MAATAIHQSKIQHADRACCGSGGGSSGSGSMSTPRSTTTTSSSSIVLPDAVFQDWWGIALIKVDTDGAEASTTEFLFCR